MPFLSPFGFPTCCGRLVGEGASNAAIIPVVTEYVVHHSQADTQDMLRALFGVTSGVLLVLTGVGIVCAAPLVRVFAPGFGPQALILTAALTEITFVYLFAWVSWPWRPACYTRSGISARRPSPRCC